MWRYKLCHTLLKIAAHAKSIFMYRNSWFLSWLGGLFNHAVLSLYIHKRSASPIVLLLYLNFIFYMKCSGEIRFLNEQVAQLSRGVEANKKKTIPFYHLHVCFAQPWKNQTPQSARAPVETAVCGYARGEARISQSIHKTQRKIKLVVLKARSFIFTCCLDSRFQRS